MRIPVVLTVLWGGVLLAALFCGSASAERRESLRLSVGESSLIRVRENITRVVVGNPQVADVRATGQREVLVVGGAAAGPRASTYPWPAGDDTPTPLSFGELFKSRELRQERSNLVVFVTPHVVSPKAPRVQRAIRNIQRLYREAEHQVQWGILD